MSVINIVKERPVLRRGSLAFTGNDEMYCLRVKSLKSSHMFQQSWDFLNSYVELEKGLLRETCIHKCIRTRHKGQFFLVQPPAPL